MPKFLNWYLIIPPITLLYNHFPFFCLCCSVLSVLFPFCPVRSVLAVLFPFCSVRSVQFSSRSVLSVLSVPSCPYRSVLSCPFRSVLSPFCSILSVLFVLSLSFCSFRSFCPVLSVPSCPRSVLSLSFSSIRSVLSCPFCPCRSVLSRHGSNTMFSRSHTLSQEIHRHDLIRFH